MNEIFNDRKHAGRLLAMQLAEFKDRPDVLVLALPRDASAFLHRAIIV